MLNEGSRRGGLGQGDGFELVCGSLSGVLALLRTMSIDGFGRSHRHHFGRCSSFLSWMDAGAPADVMSMALAKTIEAHGTKKRKHPAETTADKLKAIALSKPPSPGSLIKQVQVMSLVDDLFLDLDRVFSSNTQY